MGLLKHPVPVVEPPPPPPEPPKELPTMKTQIVLGLVRHLLTLVGSAGFMVSDSDLTSILSALTTIGSIAWSVYKNYQASKAPKV